MQRNLLEFGVPIWWIIPALLLAGTFAVLLYRKKNVPWSQNQNLILGFLRFLAVACILMLFLDPLIRKVTNQIERPIVVIGVDNSASVSTVYPARKLSELDSRISQLAEDFKDDLDYEVKVMNVSGESDVRAYDDPSTDISGFFRRVNDEHLGKNLRAVVLMTDGIYNRGASPEYSNYTYPVVAVGLGDTIPQRDLSIARINHNEVAFQGNEFPVKLTLESNGYDSQEVELELTEAGKTILTEQVTLSGGSIEKTLLVTAGRPGLRHYSLRVTELEGEATYSNNSHEIFLEVLESKKRVLIAGKSPHPDMRAIRSALEQTGNYEIVIFIEGIQPRPEGSFDVQVLFHGVEAFSGRSGIWAINSSASGNDLSSIPFVKINAQGAPDKVIPAINSSANSFKLVGQTSRLKGYPPLMVPFGEYEFSGQYEVLFYQQIGSVMTDRPLLALAGDGNRRMAISAGAGIWQWKLQEAARYGDHTLFTELVQKLIQYLSITDRKKQFRVEPGHDSFTEGEVVFFNVEIYNDIFQFVEGQSYSMEITDESGSRQEFSYVFGSDNKVASVTRFRPGTYSYMARTQVGDKRLQEKGEFVVNAYQLEQKRLTADHKLLKKIASKSGGEYFHFDEIEKLPGYFHENEFQGIIHSDEFRQPFIEVVWLLVLIGVLLSLEFILRKAWGAY